jgi:hypothetical protein
VDDVSSVGGLERSGGLHNQRDSRFDRQPPTRRLAQDGSQVTAMQQLHDDKRLAAMRTDVMDHSDSGMLQSCRDPSLAPKSPRIGEPVSHHLHRHWPLKLPVSALPHVAHAPGA